MNPFIYANYINLCPPNLILMTQAQRDKQSSIHASLKCHDGGTPSSKWTGLCKFSFSIGVYCSHYVDVIMGVMAFQITSLTIVYSTVYSDADQRKHQSSASLAFFVGNSPHVDSLHKWPVTRKMFPFDDVIMLQYVPFARDGDGWLLTTLY